jgi:hypothetical protein
VDMIVMGTAAEPGDEVRLERANNIMRQGIFAFDGWECFIGTDSINVRFDGTVYRGACKVGGAIGHISDPDLVLPAGSVICDRRRCECLSDVRATRYAGAEAKKKWQETVRELRERMAQAPITRL